MFDIAIARSQTSEEQLYEFIGTQVHRAIESGQFSYTEILIMPEPYRSKVLEYLDGFRVDSNRIPRSTGEAIDVGPVRLIKLDATATDMDPEGKIVVFDWKTRVIPGTNQFAPKIKVPVAFGADAMVPDTSPKRVARNVLVHEGWPIKQLVSKDAVTGTVVEWRWLEKAVKDPNASDDLRVLHANIAARTGDKAAATDNKKTKSTAQQAQFGANT